MRRDVGDDGYYLTLLHLEFGAQIRKLSEKARGCARFRTVAKHENDEIPFCPITVERECGTIQCGQVCVGE